MSLKEITRYRHVPSEFDTTLWKLQLIDFAGLTSPSSAVEPEVHTNMPMRRRFEGGHDGVHVPYLQTNSGRPFDTDLHDEVSTLRKHSIQGETRRTIQV
jgi:hypothetical protein